MTTLATAAPIRRPRHIQRELPTPAVYDDAVAFLTEHPERIPFAYMNPRKKGGSLFRFVQQKQPPKGSTRHCACLIQIRGGLGGAELPELTAAIRADERLPTRREDIRVEHLAVCAEWQKRCDRALERMAPCRP